MAISISVKSIINSTSPSSFIEHPIVQELRKNQVTAGVFVHGVRELLNLTQIELARILQVHQSRLSKIENGRQKISLEEWFRFCQHTGLPYELYTELNTPLNSSRSN